MGALSSFVIGAGNLASQFIWNKRNIDAQERQNALNRQMSWDMWNAENRYNSPAAQMARLRAAGLNPGLMYSDGSAGMPAAQFQSPEQTAPQGKPLYMDPQTLANARLADAQDDLAEAQADSVQQKLPFEVEALFEQNNKLRAEIRKLSAEEQDIYQQWSFREAEIAISQRIADGQIERWNAQNGLDVEQRIKTAEEYRQMVALLNLREQGLRLTNAEIRSRLNVNYAEAERLQKLLSVMTQEVIESQSRTERNHIQNYLDARAQGLDEAMAPFRAQLEKDQADLANKQAKYWDDYLHNPLKYNTKPTDVSPFMPRRGRR